MKCTQRLSKASVWDQALARWCAGQTGVPGQRVSASVYLHYLAGLESYRARLTAQPAMDYFPVPLIGLGLRQAQEQQPEAFARLDIVAQGIADARSPGKEGEQRLTVWLPHTDLPPLRLPGEGVDRVNLVWDAQAPASTASLIARYVAAMVIGYAVSFAPRRVVLDYVSEALRSVWAPWIDRALAENGRWVIEKYLEQVRCPVISLAARSPRELPALDPPAGEMQQGLARPLRILGVDIGGTSIKLQLFEIAREVTYDGHEALNLRETGDPCSLRWEDFAGRGGVQGAKNDWPLSRELGLQDADVLAGLVAERVATKEGLIAVGISLAAPLVEGVPAGVSGVLSYFQGVTKWIVEGNPLRLHELDFAAAFERRFKVASVCINDGQADLRDSEDEAAVIGSAGVSLLLKAGTGVAFGVVRDGRSCDVLGETAKAVLNLCATPQDSPLRQRFPNGVVTDYCSQKAFAILLPGEIWESITNGDRGRWLGEQLAAAVAGVPPEDIAVSADCLSTVEEFVASLEGISDLTGFHRDCLHHDASHSFSDLSAMQRFAVACAWVIGRWWADAIALTIDIYAPQETAVEARLAGGPLSGKTGLFVTRACQDVLQSVYGFTVVVGSERQLDRLAAAPGKRLHLVYPPAQAAQTGLRGAAKAALAHYRSLRACDKSSAARG